MDGSKKRKSETSNGGSVNKKSKQWRVPKKGQSNYIAPSIEPGDSGIWATCEMGKEGKSTAELRDLFEDYAKKLYGSPEELADRADSNEDTEVDIEAKIKKEVQGMKSKGMTKEALFQSVKVDVQCVLFFKTRPPIEPVSFIHTICKEAAQGALQRVRFVKRLSPMTMMGKATEDGLTKVAGAVLGPVFYGGEDGLRFAIRPTRRNHNVMKRDDIINQIARAVGRGHKVDLKGYDHLILVDIYKNVLGMSVVGSDFDELKQYNLAEIYHPTSRLKANPSDGAAPKVQVNDDSHPADVAVNELGSEDAVASRSKSENNKTSLDFQATADDIHLTAAVSDG